MFENQNPNQFIRPEQTPAAPKTPTPVALAPASPFEKPQAPQMPKPVMKKTGKMSSAGWLIISLVIIAFLGTGGYFAYGYVSSMFNKPIAIQEQEPEVKPVDLVKAVIEKITNFFGAPIASANAFANYQEPAVNVNPAVLAYQVSADLSNIENLSQFDFLTQPAKEKIVKNNFVVVPGYSQEFFSIYESNRYSFTPSFITTDSLIHNYHLAFDYLLRSIESNKLSGELISLTYEMVKTSKEQYEQLKGTAWENAAKRNVAFFTVANKLIYPNAVPVDYVADLVDKEMKLIEAHGEIAPSPVINMGETDSAKWLSEDYTQYVPRGHYTRSEALKSYFKSMMYLGRMTFRLKSPDEVKSAVLITQALEASQDKLDRWDRIYEPTSFFVGVSDDLTFNDFAGILNDVYGKNVLVNDLIDEEKFSAFTQRVAQLPNPKINSMPIGDLRFAPNREEEIKGLRFMGQRYTLDADIFQRLVYREVGDKQHACDSDPTSWDPNTSRRLPMGLDVAAAFGSNTASDLLTQIGENDYACYPQNLNKMRTYVASLDGATWTQNLYWGWLYFLRPLLAEAPQGYPSFMQNEAWLKKSLNAFLGNWTELRHDTILYVKQTYAELGGGAPEKKDDRGYVEPNPYLYARLAALAKMTKEGLQIRTLIDQPQIDLLNRLETLALRFKEISEKELNNQLLTDDDYEFIRTYGGSLEHMWLEAVKDYGIESKSQLDQEPAAIVADVATDPAGQVLEEATGNVDTIYVVFPIDGKLRIGSGAVYSYYEFAWPIGDRLTDEKWRGMLREGKQPNRPDWSASFLAQ